MDIKTLLSLFTHIYIYLANEVRDQIFNAQLHTRFLTNGTMKHFYHQGYSFCKLCTLADRNNSRCIQQDQAFNQSSLKMKVV